MENKVMVQAALEVMGAQGAERFLLHQPKNIVLYALTEAMFKGTLTDVEAYDIIAWYGAEKARNELSTALRQADQRREEERR